MMATLRFICPERELEVERLSRYQGMVATAVTGSVEITRASRFTVVMATSSSEDNKIPLSFQ